MDFSLGGEIYKKLFPKASPRSQLIQLNEELEELREARTIGNLHEKIGDVITVAVSLLKFEETKNIGQFILDKIYFNQELDERKKIMKYYANSLEKCKQRISDARYSFANGLYKRDKNFYKR